MKIALSVEKAILLRNAIQALEGYEKVIKDGSNEKVVKGYFKLDGERVLVRLAMNITALQPIVEAFTQANNALILQFADAEGKINPAKQTEFSKQQIDMQRADCEADLQRINYADLKLSENTAITGTILAGLMPILIGVPKVEDEAP